MIDFCWVASSQLFIVIKVVFCGLFSITFISVELLEFIMSAEITDEEKEVIEERMEDFSEDDEDVMDVDEFFEEYDI